MSEETPFERTQRKIAEAKENLRFKAYKDGFSKEQTVEEIVEQIDAMLDGEIHEKCLYYTYSTLKDNIALLEQALTQAQETARREILQELPNDAIAIHIPEEHKDKTLYVVTDGGKVELNKQ